MRANQTGATVSYTKSQNKNRNSPKTPTSAVGRITFDGHRDGRVLADQIATGKQLGGLRGVAALDFPNAVAQNTV